MTELKTPFAVLFLAALFTITACSSPWQDDGTGTISINVGGTNSQQAQLSNQTFPAAFSSSGNNSFLESIVYEITFTGPGPSETFTAVHGERIYRTVAAGFWTVKVNGLLKEETGSILYGIGSNTVNVIAGQSNTVSILMSTALCDGCSGWAITSATCIDPGGEKRVCDHDESHFGFRALQAPLGHSAPGRIEPTCNTPGSEGTGICTRDDCGVHVDGTPIPALGHLRLNNWTEQSAATCFEAAIEIDTCTRPDCDYDDKTISRPGQPALNHIAPDGTEPTCVTPGNTGTGLCIRGCGFEVVGTPIPALDHLWPSTWTEQSAATCVTAGSETRTCTRSGCDGFEDRETPTDPDAHNWIENWGITLVPTCINVGARTRNCNNGCSVTQTETLPTLAHDPGPAATCTTAQTCTWVGCGYLIVAALGHDITGNWTVTDTTYPAISTASCSRCGDLTRPTEIGDTGPAGGIIFYVAAPTGFELYIDVVNTFEIRYYLEAAPSDAVGTYRWEDPFDYGNFTYINTPNGAAIGTGFRNTQTLETYLSVFPAADAASSTGGGTGWFLPSIDELMAMYYANVAGLPTSGIYWSSSHVAPNMPEQAQSMDFDAGIPQNWTREFLFNVRAIRAF